jgi:hypothetical protein
LSVGLDGTTRIGVDAREILVFTLARLECTVLGIVGGIVGASNTVEDVLAVVGSVGTGRITNLEAENATTHEIVPLNDLFVVVVSARPCSRVDETAEGITTEIGAVGVQLSTKVIRLEVDQWLIDETNDLDVVRSLRVLNTLEGASGNETSAMTGLGAPRHFFAFRITDGGGTGRRCPKAEI